MANPKQKRQDPQVTRPVEYVLECLVDSTIGEKSASVQVYSETLKRNIDVYINSQRYILFKEKGCTCVECGMVATRCELVMGDGLTRGHFNFVGDIDGIPVILTKDHIIPRALGGKDIIENYQPMCQRCNQKKKAECDTTKLKEAREKGTANHITPVVQKFGMINRPEIHAYFKQWIEMTGCDYEYIKDENKYILRPVRKGQQAFLSASVHKFYDVLLATQNHILSSEAYKIELEKGI